MATATDDQRALEQVAAEFAGQWRDLLGPRVEELIAMAEETGDLATFRERLVELIAAGHWSRIEENARTAPYVMYSAVLDGRTRPAHRAWHGKVLRHDDPWWQTHTPPNGWNCRCTVIQLSERDLARLGKAGSDEAPPSPTRAWTNLRTGEVHQVPADVDPGFGYAPKTRSIRFLLSRRACSAGSPREASLFRRLREFLIAKFTMEDADTVVPSYLVKDLDAAARGNDARVQRSAGDGDGGASAAQRAEGWRMSAGRQISRRSSAQAAAITQPITVQPARKLTPNTSQCRGLPRASAASQGAKYRPATAQSSKKSMIQCNP